jgi:hypothetical protein
MVHNHAERTAAIRQPGSRSVSKPSNRSRGNFNGAQSTQRLLAQSS